MRSGPFLAILLASSACNFPHEGEDPPPSDAEIHDEHVTAAENSQQIAKQSWVNMECSADWSGRCGLLSDKLARGATIDAPPLGIAQASLDAPIAPADLAHSKLADVVRKVCEERFDRPVSDECRRKFGQIFTEALTSRYMMAGDRRLHEWCGTHPRDCDPQRPDLFRLLELDFLLANNRGVQAYQAQRGVDIARDERHEMISAEKQRELLAAAERRRQALAQAIQRAGQALSGQPTVDVYVHPAQ